MCVCVCVCVCDLTIPLHLLEEEERKKYSFNTILFIKDLNKRTYLNLFCCFSVFYCFIETNKNLKICLIIAQI